MPTRQQLWRSNRNRLFAGGVGSRQRDGAKGNAQGHTDDDAWAARTDLGEKGKKRKDKWPFTTRGEPIVYIAGIWRETKDVFEAFNMQTIEAGADIALP